MAGHQGRQGLKPRCYIEIDDGENGFMAARGMVGEDLVIPGCDSAVWPAELHEKHATWTEAFKGMPIRDLVGQPTRLLNIQTGEVVRPNQPVQYAAVSYVWAQWTGQLETMLCKLKDLMEPRGLDFVWIDQRCIDQTSAADKGLETRRMGEYYAHAAITFVMVPEWATTFIWELAGFVMRREEAAKAVLEVAALKETVWASRVWTVQEALLSNRTVFVGKTDVKSAAELAIAGALDEAASWEGDEYALAHWYTKPDGTSQVLAYHRYDGDFVSDTPILRDLKVLAAVGRYKTVYTYINDVWISAGQRQCSIEEDRVYGMLGLLGGLGMISIMPDVGFEEAVRQAADLGLVSYDILLAKTSSKKPGRSWCPQPGTESEFGASRTRLLSTAKYFQPISLTPKGLCKIEGIRFRLLRQPKKSYNFFYWGDMECGHLEDGSSFDIAFHGDLPEGENWMGDWLAVIGMADGPFSSRATLIKYETLHEGILRKVLAVEAGIKHFDKQKIEPFLLG